MSDSFTAIFGISIDKWPIPEAAVLISESTENAQLLFIGLPDGSLGIRIVRNGTSEDYKTDILAPDAEFKIVVSIAYSPLSLHVRINGTDLVCAPLGQRVKIVTRLKAPPQRRSSKPVNFSLNVPPFATDAEALFARTIGDLSLASESNDWHVLLKSSAHLRLFLLDGLFHKASENHRLKVGFMVAGNSAPPPIAVDKQWISIAPHDIPLINLVTVNLEQLLKLKVFESKGESITVRDVIRAAANADGGIHFGRPTSAEEKLVLVLDKESMRFGQASSRHILRDICKVVVAGSIPLIERIQDNPVSA